MMKYLSLLAFLITSPSYASVSVGGNIALSALSTSGGTVTGLVTITGSSSPMLSVQNSSAAESTTVIVGNGTVTDSTKITNSGNIILATTSGTSIQVTGAAGQTGYTYSGTAPASVAGNGTSGGTSFLVSSSTGGATSGVTGQTGGTGQGVSISTGSGGQATGASGANIGGQGGTFLLTTTAGGAVTSATGTGGAGGTFTITLGNGSGTGATGGAGGSYGLTAGTGGNGSTTGGIGGSLTFTAGASGTGGNVAGGAVTLIPGNRTGSGATGKVIARAPAVTYGDTFQVQNSSSAPKVSFTDTGQAGFGNIPGTSASGDVGRIWVLNEGATSGVNTMSVILNAVGSTTTAADSGTYAATFISGRAAGEGGVVAISRSNSGNALEVGGTQGSGNFRVAETGAVTIVPVAAVPITITGAAATDGIAYTGTAPASVAGNGTAAGFAATFTGAAGGASSGTTGQTGGIGEKFSWIAGNGGAVAGASGIGGAGGGFTVTAGNGGNGATTGGVGGGFTIGCGNAGTGGNAAGGSFLLTVGAKTGSGAVGVFAVAAPSGQLGVIFQVRDRFGAANFTVSDAGAVVTVPGTFSSSVATGANTGYAFSIANAPTTFATFGSNATIPGAAPASVAGNGTAAINGLILGAAGGATSGTTGQTAGAGSSITFTGGAGGAATGASGANVAGNALGIIMAGGAGGAVTSATGSGGAGGPFSWIAGNGSGTGATGGAGGAVTITAGNGGNGTTTGGIGGVFTINSGSAGTGGAPAAGNIIFNNATAMTTGILIQGASTTIASFDTSNKRLRIGDATAPTATLDIVGKLTIGTSGTIPLYNSETTAGAGIPYILALGQDVASSGAGAQTTVITSKSTPATGSYIINVVASATTDDTITVTLTYTDAVNTTAQTKTLMSAVALGTNGTSSASFLARANGSSTISVQITVSAQATTKCTASIMRIN